MLSCEMRAESRARTASAFSAAEGEAEAPERRYDSASSRNRADSSGESPPEIVEVEADGEDMMGGGQKVQRGEGKCWVKVRKRVKARARISVAETNTLHRAPRVLSTLTCDIVLC